MHGLQPPQISKSQVALVMRPDVLIQIHVVAVHRFCLKVVKGQSRIKTIVTQSIVWSVWRRLADIVLDG